MKVRRTWRRGRSRPRSRAAVFEKAGVNVSTVAGQFSEEFSKTIHGAETPIPNFFATGISLVAHMANPHVPAVHMNLRFLNTTKSWFGGGADLNPPIPYKEDTDYLSRRTFGRPAKPMIRAIMSVSPKWADDYFWIPHRNVARGVGGIFFRPSRN